MAGNGRHNNLPSMMASPLRMAILLLLLPLIIILNIPTGVSAFNLYIGADEMNRTLGISARMDYVTSGQINEYSTKFPYRVAENISRIRFSWSNPGKTSRYSLRVVSEQFDVLPVLLVPAEGIVPRTAKSFLVEYRCVGARSGQFQVFLHFNISLRPPLQFTLKQEKICSYIDGRRAFAGEEDDSTSADASVDNGNNSLLGQLIQLPLFCQLLLAFLLLLLLLCALLFCCCYCLRVDDPKGAPANESAVAPQSAAFRRRSKIGSIYASTRSSIRMKLNHNNNGQRARQNQRLGVTFGGSPASNGIGTGGAAGIGHATTSSLAPSSSLGAAEECSNPRTPFLASSADSQMPSTSTAPFPTGGGGNSLGIPPQKGGGGLDRILFERPEAQQLDISQALVDLNADRNLFEQAQRPEMEGQFGQLVWANWRQIGSNGNRPVVDEVDDEEDDAKEDKALICKTLKPGAGRVQFERFLRNALQFHHVPAHSHLSQVIAAATFGNFMNPESVKDLPLICYAHDGFGLLKTFLQTCRAQSSGSGGQEWVGGEQCSAMRIGGGEAAADTSSREFGEGSGGAGTTMLEEQQQQKPRIVVTNTPSNALSTTFETTLRTHDLCSMAIQVIGAVRHLHKFGIIHKDIATRNCLVSRARLPLKFGSERLRLHVQLCDSALSRDFFPEDYAVPPPNCAASPEEAEPCPVRWMAPELLRNPPAANNEIGAGGTIVQKRQQSALNSATDIWAYGVLLWELFTCGQQPYGEMHTDEFAQALLYAGLRLSQPYNCPDELYAHMCQCWAAEPPARPTAAEMDHQLQEFMNRLRKYI